ncbi:MAG: hypothetical protein M3Y04_05185 [Actinomycetota bacterium]|nr:hypothetical protein [Actinomycetota bacterium]
MVHAPVAPDSPADGQPLQRMCMETETGFCYVLIEDDDTGRDDLVPAGSVR